MEGVPRACLKMSCIFKLGTSGNSFAALLGTVRGRVSSSPVCPTCRQRRILPKLGDGASACRQSSTTAKSSPAIKTHKWKRRIPNLGKYAEIIEITDLKGSRVEQGRKPVTKSSPGELLNQINKVNPKKQAPEGTLPVFSSKNWNNPDCVEASPDLATFCGAGRQLDSELLEDAVDAAFEAEEDVIPEPVTRKSAKKLKLSKEDRIKLIKCNQIEMEKAAKQVQLFQALRSYLDVCVNLNMLNKAYNTLLAYRTKSKDKVLSMLYPRLYRIIINGVAQKGNWSVVKELLKVTREANFTPMLSTYVSCMECISRLPTCDKKVVGKLLDEARKDGLDILNLDHECQFVGDQRERVIKVIRTVLPDFEPRPIKFSPGYEGPLLASLNEPLPEDHVYFPCGHIFKESDLIRLAEQQMQVELDGEVEIESVARRGNSDPQLSKYEEQLRVYEEEWRRVLTTSFEFSVKRLQEHIRSSRNSWDVNMVPFLTVLDAEVYVNIILREIRSLAESSESFSPPMASLYSNIGNKVMNRYLVQMKQNHGVVDKIKVLYSKYCQYYCDQDLTSRYSPREYWEHLLATHQEGPTIGVEDSCWPGPILLGIGKFLYEFFVRDIKINVSLFKSTEESGREMPAFYYIYRSVGIQVRQEIKPHPVIVKLYRMCVRNTLTFEGATLPMLAPPLPWTSISNGAFLLSPMKAVRLPDAAIQSKLRLEQTPSRNLNPVFDSLNLLGECPWVINKPVLDVIIELFNNKGDESLDIPPPPIECSSLPTLELHMTKAEKAKVFRDRLMLVRRRAEMYSLWCDALYKLSIANHLRDKVFWFPHNLDFRGRVYPCPPHFNHLGNDVSRSVLFFAKGEPLGEHGMRWLKIHLINLTGLKKRESLESRLQYANEMMPEIVDSAENPLNGRRWWTKSEEPWQTLACCMEIVRASTSPDPTKYVCKFPVHQDGSCNGLQHYAALGRDQHGAEKVNLLPMDEPQDVYSGVASLVEVERAKDAKHGDAIAQLLEGVVKRKLIKQTVMTTVYGVTRYGARLQIIKQLKDVPDFPQDKNWVAASYLVQKTFLSLQMMFTATKEIQEWLTDSARNISAVCGQSVEWVTPLGLPVVQPYYKPQTGGSALGSADRYQMACLTKLDVIERPNVSKQKNAFPPNFIHSLDSTHMMLTSLHCRRNGITFVSVHDCFWTHPSTVSTMNRLCREQFLSLHSEPLLENLSKFLMDKYGYSNDEFSNDGSVVDLTKWRLNKLLTSIPQKGSFQLENVIQSTYFFS